MRRLLYLAPFVLFLAVAGWFALGLQRDPQKLPSMLIDRPAPAFDLPALRNEPAGLARADLAGGPMLVNFFASWCGPCRVEHPLLLRLAAEGVKVYGINYKDRPADALAWLQALGDPYGRIGADRDGRTAIEWGVYGVPETYVVDAQGHIRYRHVGPVLPDDLEKVIRPLLRARP